MYPKEIPADALFGDAKAAITGENSMKKRLKELGRETLGREFYLVGDHVI